MATILNIPVDKAADAVLMRSVATGFRQHFELDSTAEALSGKEFMFSRFGTELYPYLTPGTELSEVPECIDAVKEKMLLASVDSTCVLIGETFDGALYAARAGVGLSMSGSSRKFIRLGPAIIYLSAERVYGLESNLGQSERNILLSDHGVAERVIRNVIERSVIDSLLASEQELIVMADGSLKHPLGQFSLSLPRKENPLSSVIGFSKSSSLVLSAVAASLVSRARGPAFRFLDGGPIQTVAAKFSADGLVFRVDLACLQEHVRTILGRILWNDTFTAGYPESLRLAHHLSVFTRAEQAALKAFVTSRFRLKQIPAFNLRHIALGSLRGSS